MDMKLELVPLHVSNVNRAKAFHAEIGRLQVTHSGTEWRGSRDGTKR